MATGRITIYDLRLTNRSPLPRDLFILHSSFFILLLFLAACSSVRPVTKIGLIAPFEGLHRDTGYTALAAMRAAIVETPGQVNSAVDLLPLALDDSGEPARTQRATQKLLVDSTVVAVIGPLAPASLAQMERALPQNRSVVWLAPFLINPQGGFVEPAQALAEPALYNAWAIDLLAAVAHTLPAQKVSHLVLAGGQSTHSGWPQLSTAQWQQVVELPVLVTDDLNQLQPGDALFWLGNAEEGATFLTRLRQQGREMPFWLGPAGGDPIFAQRAINLPSGKLNLSNLRNVYWATWVGEEYTTWAVDHAPASPAAYQVYAATRLAIQRVLPTGQRVAIASEFPKWRIQYFAYTATGESVEYTVNNHNLSVTHVTQVTFPPPLARPPGAGN